MFEFTVEEVFNLPRITVLCGKGNIPLYDGKIKSDNVELEIKPAWGNTEDKLDNLAFQVWKGKADKSFVGKTFKSIA